MRMGSATFWYLCCDHLAKPPFKTCLEFWGSAARTGQLGFCKALGANSGEVDVSELRVVGRPAQS